MRTLRLKPIAAAAAAAAVLSSCDEPTRPITVGEIAPHIALVQPDSATRASLVLPLTSVRVRAIGATTDTAFLTLDGGFWRGSLTGLPANTYELIVEGIAAGQVQFYGRVPTVTVARGQRVTPSVQFVAAVPTVTTPTLQNTTSFSQRIPFARIPSATSYVYQVSEDPLFTSFVEQAAADSNPLVAVTDTGTWHLRTRAVLPQVAPATIPWSETRSWTVVAATGRDNGTAAQVLTLVSEEPQTIADRNLTVAKREDWYRFDLRAGDSLFVETFAARLANTSQLNTTLTLFGDAAGTAQLEQNLDAPGTNDARLVYRAASTGTHWLRVGATGAASGHFELRAEMRRLPADPDGFTAQIVSGSEVTLRWNDNADNETSYRVERCDAADCVNFAEVATPDADVDSLVVTGLTQGTTYRWRVRARNGVGNSAYTAIVQTALVGPNPPTGLTATTVSNTRIDLQWVDASDNETGFEVQRCTGAACTDFTTIATPTAGTQAYSDLTAVYNTAYRYQVRALNNVLPSAFSPVAAGNTFPPPTPTALTAATAGPTRIGLSWTSGGAGATFILIERCLGDACSSFAVVDSVPGAATAFTDSTVSFNSGYRYRVRARNAVVSQDVSNIVGANTRPPAAATGLTATTQGPTAIALAWTDVATNETGYEIQRCSSGAGCVDFAPIDTAAAAATAFTDNSVSVGNSYRYRIVALGVAGNSAASNIAEANTLLPDAPQSLAATTLAATVIRLTWTQSGSNATGYALFRCATAGCSNFTLLTNFAAPATSFDDSTAVAGTSYVYQLRATNIAGQSLASNSAAANTLPPSTPTGFTATVTSGTTVSLSWTNVGSNLTGTRIERCEGAGCSSFTLVQVVPAPTAVYVDTSVTVGQLYSYRLAAQNAAATSAFTATVGANTSLPAAVTLTAVVTSTTTARLDWTASAGPNLVGYVIERCSGAGCTPSSVIDSVAVAVTGYDDSGLVADTDYRYAVRPVNAVGRGNATPAALATRVPVAPTASSATVGVGYVDVAFVNNATDATSLVLERSCVGGACAFTELATLAANALSPYRDTAVVADSVYLYRLRADNAVGQSLYSNEISANTSLAQVPGALSATTANDSTIVLAWTDLSNNELGFTIERCIGDGCTNFVVIDTLSEGTTGFVDTGLAAQESYTYQVRSLAPFGPSAASAPATATTRTPAAVTGLAANTQSNTSIRLTWTDNANNESGVRIERCEGGGCGDFAEVGNAPADALSYEDTGLTPSTVYRYRVVAVNTAGAAAPSNIAEATTNLPAIPTALRAADVASTELSLVWTDNASDELDQDLQSCAGVGCSNFATAMTVPTNVAAALLAGLTAGETYSFRVRARNGAGFSDFSNVVTVTLAEPATPTGFTATTQSGTSIQLAWTDVANNETSLNVERCVGDGCVDFSNLTTLPQDATSFTDNSVTVGNFYRYRLIGANSVGLSAPTAPAAANTMMPDAPSDLDADIFSSTRIDLTWTDNGPFETAFQIERCAGVGCTDFALVNTTAANATSYSDAGLTPNETYRYRVRAVNAVGASAYTAIVESATNVPADPTELAAVAISTSRIDLSWSDNASNETNYQIERCQGVLCGVFSPLALIAGNLESYSDETVGAGLTYSYRIRALNANGFSAFSNIATTNTDAPAAPTALTATTLSGTRIDLSWTENANNELSVVVERADLDVSPTFNVIATLGPDSSVYSDESVVVDRLYRYRVRVINNIAASAYTGEVDANTLRPDAPLTVTASTVTASRIDLSWTDAANNEQGYRLERCSGDGCTDFALLTDLPSNSTSYSDVSVAAAESYRYRVSAFNVAGQSLGVVAEATTRVPEAPTGLTVLAASATQVDLNWTDNSLIEDGYRIEQCEGLGCSNFLEVGVVGPDQTSYSATGLNGSSFYSFRVRAFNASGLSAYTATGSTDTFAPAAPSALSATTVLGNRIDLSWTDAATNETGFQIERCLGGGCVDFALVGTTATNQITYQDLTVTPGNTYRYRVRAVNGVGVSTYSAPATGNTNVPATPTSLVATAAGVAQINLTWTDNATTETGYRVERCAGDGCTSFALLQTLGADASAFSDNTVASGTAYRYRVQATGNGSSDFSNIADAATVLPAAPTFVQAVAVSDTRIDLSWTDNANNENGFAIERCSGSGCVSFAPLTTVPANTTTYSDEGLTPGAVYRYQVRAFNDAGVSDWENSGGEVQTNVPAFPTDLAASASASGEITLTWVDNAGTETGFRIERCEGSGCTNFVQVAEIPTADIEAFVDVGLVDGTFYRYRVRAFNAAGPSGPSAPAGVTAGLAAAPATLTATTISASRIDLAWPDASDNETGFAIYRCSGAACDPTGLLLTTVAANATSFEDASVAIGTSYTYAVAATNAVGASALSPTATATTILPADPTGLTAQSVSATQVNLSWTDNADNEDGYRVERCLDGSCTFAQIVQLPADATSYSATGLTEGETYRFRVYAFNAAGNSGFTSEVLATTDFPLPPSGLTATTLTATRIDLAWTDNASNEDGFEVVRCEGVGCTPTTLLGSVGANVTAYSDLTVTLGNSYSYRVRATRPAANSDYTEAATANTFLPAVPTFTSAVATSATSATLEWNDDTTATGVVVERCVQSSCTWAQVASVPRPTLTYLNTGLTTGVTYLYRLRRFNAAGFSDATPEREVRLIVPAVPTGAEAIAISSTAARVTWTDASTDETGFRIERCDGVACVVYNLRGTVGADVTSFDDGPLTPGISYSYRVQSLNALGASAVSNVATVVMVAPAAPNGLIATTLNGSSIGLQWNDLSNNERGFLIERCVGVGCATWVQIAAVGAGQNNYVNNTGISLNETYSYRVRAFNSVGTSAYTVAATANTIVPAAPSGLVTQTLSGTSIRLTWTDNATTETGYRVFRCALGDCADAVIIATLPANSTLFDDTGLTFGTQYFYVVRAFNVPGPSPISNIAQGSTVLGTPSALRAWTYNRNSVRLTWTDNAVFEDGVAIEACEGAGCSSFAPVATAGANATQFIVGSLNPASEYSFRVRATSPTGTSAYSTTSGARTPVTIATDAVVTGIADTAFGERHYVMTVPPGTTQLRVLLEPAGADPDLYVRLALSPAVINTGAASDTLCIPYSGGIETCTFNNPSPGDWYVMVQGYFNQYSGARLSVVLGPTSFNVTNCNQSGAVGPSALQCALAYNGTSNSGRVLANNGIQTLTLPHTGRYRIVARGAQGASGDSLRIGGRGAQMSGEFTFTAGTVLRMAVGQVGTGTTVGGNGGGGGGSFVLDALDNPLIIAGGGGGARFAALQNGCDASIEGFGISGSGQNNTHTCAPKIVNLGLGGIITSPFNFGAAGAGLLGNGQDDGTYGLGGRSWANGLGGGTLGISPVCSNIAFGGFGGGGAGNGCRGGGGGGGYSGGDGGWIAGGGGSFNSGTNQSNVAGVGVGNGLIQIQYIGPANP